jgi:hypothetical protein
MNPKNPEGNEGDSFPVPAWLAHRETHRMARE